MIASLISKMTSIVRINIFFACILLSCHNGEHAGDKPLSSNEEKQYSIKGDSIVKLTFDTLRSALQQSIREKGVGGAIEYCNINAAAITSLYERDGVVIRRTAQKYRNPSNAPDSIEKVIFRHYDSLSGNKQPLQHVVMPLGGKVHYFKPIILQPMCRNCHGAIGSDIQPGTMGLIKRSYPSDRATGFSDGDLRGIWHVSFPRN